MFSKLKSTRSTIIFSLLCLATFSANPEPKPIKLASPAKTTTVQSLLSKLKNSKVGKFCKKHPRLVVAGGSVAGVAGAAFLTKVITGAAMINSCLHSKSRLEREKAESLKALKNEGLEYRLINKNGADGILFGPKNPKLSDKLTVYFLGKSDTWQARCGTADRMALAKESDTPVLMLNYSGVGDSSGFPWGIGHISKKVKREILDVEKEFKFDSKKTVFVGHSMGGWVGSKVASEMKRPMFSNRSFDTMSKAAEQLAFIPETVGTPLFWATDWDYSACSAANPHNFQGFDYAYSENDPITRHEASKYAGFLKRSIRPRFEIKPFSRMYKEALKLPCTNPSSIRGHDLEVIKSEIPKEGEQSRNPHCYPMTAMKCKECDRTLLRQIVDFIKQN